MFVQLEVPKELITSSQLQDLRLQRKPSFIPLSQEVNTTKLYDKETGITQRRLSNGIPVNYKITKNEARGGVMRLIVGGGRATESSESRGAVVVGVRTLSEGGRVGDFSREQVELFCVNHLINCSLESTEEFICMEFRFTLRDGGMRAAFQLLHMVLEHSVWLEDAFDRARQLYLSYYRSIPKSLERSTAHKLMLAMLNGDERFVEPTPQSLQNLTLQSVKDAVMNQFVGDNMEVSIVGDFTEDDIESCILDYLGTIRETRDSESGHQFNPIIFRPSPSDLQFQQVRNQNLFTLPLICTHENLVWFCFHTHACIGQDTITEPSDYFLDVNVSEVFLKDTDERACAYIAGPAPNRWGFTVEGKDLFDYISNTSHADDEQSNSEESLVVERKDVEKVLQRKLRSHPLFFGISLGLLAEIINSRLFTSVRDSLGLTYDVSFELSLFDRLKLGWYVISVTSTPGKVHFSFHLFYLHLILLFHFHLFTILGQMTEIYFQVYKAVDACKNVLRGLLSSKIAQRELDRVSCFPSSYHTYHFHYPPLHMLQLPFKGLCIGWHPFGYLKAKRTLLMRHEAETKSNPYWLGLLAHLQASSVPRKDISCIKDLTSLFEAATIEDIYIAYEHLKVDDNSLYACIGIAGSQAGEEISGKKYFC
ncbi:hypothetical protein HHK36_002357 [Tetracentron sinense]|uniref:Peptidase M16 C-terminal domain-containing protein n=1 Tax=Tetracentron sinense TaxID=13715 RepID=A0A834ZLW5_TETSI|nr:hypothetical protein HHK36_002357 [Tetracentron sinense]